MNHRVWLTIEGEEFDLHGTVLQPELGALIDLKRASRVDGFEGISVATIKDTLDAMDEAFDAIPEGTTRAEMNRVILRFFDSIEHLTAFVGLVFLARRSSGVPITFEDAARVRLADVGFRVEGAQEEDEADDPKAPSTPEGDEPDETVGTAP